MNFNQLRNSTRTRIGNPSTTDLPDMPNLGGHINDAYQEIFNKYKHRLRRARAKFTTVIAADKYNLSGLTDVVYKVWDRTNGKELTKIGISIMSEQDYDASPNNLVVNARPAKWNFIETYLQIFPPPDGAYDIEFLYKVIFVPLVGDSDIPAIPANWHRGIVILASHMYYDDEGGDPIKATYHKQMFRDWISDQPVEEHEATEAIDSGVEIPTLATSPSRTITPDGVWWDIVP